MTRLTQCRLLQSLAILSTIQHAAVHAANSFKLASYYSDHMVLQMEPSRAVIWGFSDISANITLEFKGKAYTSEAAIASFTSLGVWRVTLDPQPPSGPFNIQVSSNFMGIIEVIDLQDVLFGDVWVCSGQSNMAFDVKEAFNGSATIQQSYQYPNIRVLSVYQNDSSEPLHDFAELYQPWSRPDPVVLGQRAPAAFLYFSSVCWLFGRNLYDHFKYPIGLISSNWGGTPIEDWSSPDVLATCGVKEDSMNAMFKNGFRKEGLWGPHVDSGLWNGMIHPMINMSIKGAIWYQGEANTGNPGPYKCLFPTMIQDWREKWYEGTGGATDPSFPFGFVQLCTSGSSSPDDQYTALRWHQTVDYGYVPNPKMPSVFMAVAIDLPDPHSPFGEIHPRYKQDVADRLSLGARSVAYGEGSVTFQGPFPSAVIRISSTDILVEFDDGKASIMVKNVSKFDACCSTSPVNCPLVAKGSPWQPVTSNYELGQSHVIMQDPCVAGGEKAAMLRYIWHDHPCIGYKNCQLYDAKSALPVPPFIKEVENDARIESKIHEKYLKFRP